MSIHKINIIRQDQGIGQVGGGAWLDSLSDWPVCQENGAFMVPLFSFSSAFFPTPMIPSDFMVTVFLPPLVDGGFSLEYSKRISHNSSDNPLDLSKLPTKVMLHKKASEELYPDSSALLPKGYLSFEEMNDEEFDKEIEDEVNGIEISKLMGRAHWLQDLIRITPRYTLLSQFNEMDLVKFSPAFKGIFNQGIGYVFMDYRIKKLNALDDAGFFFTQYI